VIEVEPAEPAASQSAQNTVAPVGAEMLHQSGSPMIVGEQIGREVGEAHEWDILKSIVYGGLIESITSLGIVLSAAGAGAAPSKCFTPAPQPPPNPFWVTFLKYKIN
jgi:hypothetical protein